MSKASTLLRRIKAAQRRVAPSARTHLFVVEVGPNMQPHDTITVYEHGTAILTNIPYRELDTFDTVLNQHIPKGMLGLYDKVILEEIPRHYFTGESVCHE